MMRKHLRAEFLFFIALSEVSVLSPGCFDDEFMGDALQTNGSPNTVLPGGDGGVDIYDDTSGDSTDGNVDGCNPNREPTWVAPINAILQSQCTVCHVETASYERIQTWVNNGLLKQYCEMGSAHFLQSGQEDCLRWVEIGAPNADCDVLTTKK